MRRVFMLLAAVALVVVVIVGLGQAGGSKSENTAARFDLEAAKRQLQGAPAPLAALHEQSSALLPAGFDRAVDDLEGHPVVVNKWASWCRPCRAEFPIFQRVATARGKEIGFLGLNAEDKRPAAESFLRERPLPYPSYEDPDEAIARELRASKFFPMTIFIDRRGDIEFVKAGEYTSEAELEADLDKYL